MVPFHTWLTIAIGKGLLFFFGFFFGGAKRKRKRIVDAHGGKNSKQQQQQKKRENIHKNAHIPQKRHTAICARTRMLCI